MATVPDSLARVPARSRNGGAAASLRSAQGSSFSLTSIRAQGAPGWERRTEPQEPAVRDLPLSDLCARIGACRRVLAWDEGGLDMQQAPGDLTPEESKKWIEDFRERAVQRWGKERAEAIREVLESTALAAGRVLKIEFVHDEAPGFYLPTYESDGGWEIR